MSTLREIMEKFAQSRADATPGRVDHAERLKFLVDEYETRLGQCTEAMLHYEWAWLKRHIEDLNPGDNPDQLEEAMQYRSVLEDMFNQRMLHPHDHPWPVDPASHAWEVSLESIRKQWGLN